MAKSTVTNDLAANIAKATQTKPTPAAKPKADADKPRKAKPAAVPEVPPPAIPIQPGSPCQKKGCHGHYSILQTERKGSLLIHDVICRTCGLKPAAAILHNKQHAATAAE